RRGRTREGRRTLGRCIRLACQREGPGRSGQGARKVGEGEEVLRVTELGEPLRDPLPAARREETRDAGSTSREIRRDAEERREASPLTHRRSAGSASVPEHRHGSRPLTLAPYFDATSRTRL